MSRTPITKDREYWLKFDIEKKGNKVIGISGVRVHIGRAMETDTNAKFDVSLAADPLYPALVEYVKNNPLRGGDDA